MIYSYNESQKQFQNEIAMFAKKHSFEKVPDLDKKGSFNRDLWNKLAEIGLQGGILPEEYGGRNMDLMSFISGLESLGKVCPDIGILFSLCAHVFACELTILNYGSAEQKNLWLPRLCNGEWVSAIAIAELEGASDAFNMQTIATPVKDGYIINGTKAYVTNAPFCDMVVVFAIVENTNDIIAVIVDKNNSGMQRSEIVQKLGMRTAPFGNLVFNNCFVQKGSLIKGENSGKFIFMSAMEWERGCIVAPALGLMEKQFEDIIRYLKNRRQGDNVLSDFQCLKHRIVDMKMRLELSRLILYRFAWEKQTRKRANMYASMAKLYISEAIVQNSLDAMQMQGAYGYTCESIAQKNLRDALAYIIASGTSDIQKNIIARWLGL